ncbi:MarR family winged helix-turn-helix transcriptional regulator [Cellulomonas wangsupingiae]|uniref:MarR family winged helix-turn-helix transcriptional regulator n=1 Tax=Cellulomonas wangsupingiae TaxID=2968085 RepID=A0ABY5K956_9CELL|nr:MarR family winged helix-turn-helix transcriptional regulator [Cellulomonas wangsupingiae]MCC2334983.1 MarR family winged helix-turn-helix transcriptional regulator [Cellulomonas wangsupingiae]UUI65481.1 MarR family winged helix-turn-helix transcriptional regulator [Cellulomonas wangsupingiae]
MEADRGTLLIDLVRVETTLYNLVDGRLKDAGGLTLPQLELLSVIRDVPGCRVVDVARSISLTVGAASKAVDRLEEQGWCRRAADRRDGRSSTLTLTPHGSAAVDRAAAVFDAATRDIIGPLLPAVDAQRLAELLATLRAALQPSVDPRAGVPHREIAEA